MYEKLDYKDYVPHAPSIPGRRIKIAHTNCDNGVDWKDRLFIKRETDGTILAFCHNCQKSGRYKEKGHIINVHDLLELEKHKIKKEDKELKPPDDLIIDTDSFPLQYRAWINQYNIDPAVLDVAYSPKYDRILFPTTVYRDGERLLVSWQGRSLDPTQEKYITVSLPGSEDRHLVHCRYPISEETIVLTEDALSAYKVSRFLPAMALQGVSISDRILVNIATQYKNVIIFLDDDNPTVKKAQKLLQQQLSLVLTGGAIVAQSKGKDPKEYPYSILKRSLELCMTGIEVGASAINVSYVETDTTLSSVSGIPKEK